MWIFDPVASAVVYRGDGRVKHRLVTGKKEHIFLFKITPSTYDHRVWKTGLPVRSAVLKPHAGELVVGWVTTSESSLLYVFCFSFVLFIFNPPRGNEIMLIHILPG